MILDDIVEDKRERLSAQKKETSAHDMRELAEMHSGHSRGFYHALAKEGISVIGEFKKASPSLGKIKSKINLSDRIREYNASVDAISCLTEESYFHGSRELLTEIREKTNLPVLRKDFIIDPYQIYESKVIGADAILLIAAILDDAQLTDYYELAAGLGLDALVEIHSERELERALRAGASIIGINNRNLKDFSISLETTMHLAASVPGDRVLVSESGILKDEDVQLLKNCGVDALLVGRALMEAGHPMELVKRWKECSVGAD